MRRFPAFTDTDFRRSTARSKERSRRRHLL
jgi:hypothetical protein